MSKITTTSQGTQIVTSSQLSANGLPMGGLGSIGEFRAAQFHAMEQRHGRPFAENAHKLIDDTVVSVGLERLSFAAEVIRRGLTFPMPTWLGNPIFQWEYDARRGRAHQTMNPTSKGERSLPDLIPAQIPIYVTMEQSSWNIRSQLVSERSGMPLNTDSVRVFTRNINESIEDQAINGSELTVAGSNAPGLLNAPNAATFAYTGNVAWTAGAHDPEDKVADVQAAITLLEANNRFGPYVLVLNGPYGRLMDDDYSISTGLITTIGERLRMIGRSTGQELTIVVSDFMPADRISVVSMEVDVLDMIEGQQPTAVTWSDGPGWEQFVAVLACMILRVKTDYEGKSGIANGDIN